MTKYILHGGATSASSESNQKFFAEILKGLESPVKVLIIYFAISKDKWNELLEDDRNKFQKANPDRELELIMASDDIQALTKQIASADAIYMRGGREITIHTILKQIKNLPELFSGKTVAGSSAGAYTLSKYFYSNSRDSFEEGTGVLPVKTLAHYSNDLAEILDRLKNYKEDLEIYTIPETEFIVIER